MLHRSEVVALINTLHRFSESLEAVNDFRTMWAETSDKDSVKLIQEAEAVASIHARVRPYLARCFRIMLIIDAAETLASRWLFATARKLSGGDPNTPADLGGGV